MRTSSYFMLVLHMCFHLTNTLTLRREWIVLRRKIGDMTVKSQGFMLWLQQVLWPWTSQMIMPHWTTWMGKLMSLLSCGVFKFCGSLLWFIRIRIKSADFLLSFFLLYTQRYSWPKVENGIQAKTIIQMNFLSTLHRYWSEGQSSFHLQDLTTWKGMMSTRI